MKFTDASTIRFVAVAILNEMRRGTVPIGGVAADLVALPLIDELRQCTEDDDLRWILPGTRDSPTDEAALHVSLLKRFAATPDVQHHLRSMFDTPNTSESLRTHIMWRLLDDPDLPLEWHEKLFTFVLKEWSTFHAIQLRFFGADGDVILPYVLGRIGDTRSPTSKKWAYLCCLPEAVDSRSAQAVLQLSRTASDPFLTRVADTLLRRFFNESAPNSECDSVSKERHA